MKWLKLHLCRCSYWLLELPQVDFFFFTCNKLFLCSQASVNGDSFNICKSSHKEPHEKNTDVVLKFKMTLIQKNKTKHIYMYTKHNGGDAGKKRISLHQNKCVKKILLLRLSGDQIAPRAHTHIHTVYICMSYTHILHLQYNCLTH